LVERDAAALWHARGEAGQRRTRVDLRTVDDPACRSVLDRFERAGVLAAAWEITSDVGLPAFRAVVLDEDPGMLRPYLPGTGSGCHCSRAVALLRALTEAAQTRLTLITGARDDMGIAHYVAAGDPAIHARMLARLRNGNGERSWKDAPTFEGDTFDDDLAHQLGRLSAAGVSQVVVVDLTKPALAVPVARVVIPGLEGVHDAPGYAPGVRYQRAMDEEKRA
jgi:ribosomal protein S12 methylthiotransferase accessory factor